MTELIGQLTSQLGIDETQAKSGLGAVFQTAQSNLDADSLSKLTGAFPDIAGFLGDSSADNAGGGLMGMAMSALGGAGGLGQAAQLAAGFQKAGLDVGMITKFAPIVMDYFTKNGDDTVKAIISKLF